MKRLERRLEELSDLLHGVSLVRECSPRIHDQVSSYGERLSADITAAARVYSNGPSVFVSGHGIDAFDGGFQAFRAFHCLLAVCGNLMCAAGIGASSARPECETIWT